MHISPDRRRDANVVAAWALAVADAVRLATEKSMGVGGNGPAALVAIVADPGLSIDELRKVLTLTHPGTVRLVDRLMELGLVARRQGPGRVVRLDPTAAGRDAERRLATARGTAVTEALAGLSDRDVHVMAELADPVLTAVVDDVSAVRRLCRLCDRSACDPCPVEDAVPARGVP